MNKPIIQTDKFIKQQQKPIHDQNKQVNKNDEYFDRVKDIYKGKTNRARYSQHSEYKPRGVSQNTDHIYDLNRSPKNHSIQKATYNYSGIDLLNKSADQPSGLVNEKIRTQSRQPSPKKMFFHNKVQKQRKFRNQWQNDKMMKRLNQIKNRKNKYMKESLDLMQFQKEHKMMHESSVIANRKLLEMQIEQKNDKFVDRLVERVKYKQTIKPTINQRVSKCVKLEQSRMKVEIGSKSPVHLPPMVFN